MICCKQQCDTPFCPTCGKSQTSAIYGLLDHLRRRIESQKKNFPNVKEERAEIANLRIEKWKSWEKAVIDLQVAVERMPKA